MNLLEDLMSQEPVRTRKFDIRHIRVSNIGKCARFQVANALGQVADPAFHPYYTRMGHTMQALIADDLRERGCKVEEEIEVFTGLYDDDGTKVWCHPDMHVEVTGMGPYFGIQMKTVTQEKLDKMTEPRREALDQATLEWALFQKYGSEGMDGKLEVPEQYFVLYASRESAALNYKAFEVEWSMKEARRLMERYYDLERHRKTKQIPPRPFTRPQLECAWDAGLRGSHRCEWYDRCWNGEGKL
jgi:hypothetical protein